MANNPFIDGAPRKAGKVTEQQIRDYAERLNAEAWVRFSGKHYFVNKRLNDKGEEVHYLDREGAA